MVLRMYLGLRRFFSAHRGNAPTGPFLRASARLPLFPDPSRQSPPQGPGNAKRLQDFSCRQFVVGLPFRESVKPPLFVPVFRDRLSGELFDGQPIGFDPGESRLDDVRGETIWRILQAAVPKVPVEYF